MKNVPDELLPLLRNRPGDLPMPGNSRWGKVALLTTGTAGRRGSLTFVHTDVISPTPIPIAVKLRFSLDNITFTPEVPATFGGNVIVDMIETIDMKSGPFKESFTLEPGDVMPLCTTIACALTLSVKLDAEDTGLYVEAVAAPTTTIDCADVVGPTPAVIPAGIVATATTRWAAVTANTYNIGVDALRGLFVIVNQSAANLFVHLGTGVTITPGGEFATVVLPPNAFGGFEALNYRGEIYFRFDADDADGYALTTIGSY